MTSNADRAATLVRALEASIVGDNSAVADPAQLPLPLAE
jgi:hypothetical protein